MVKRPTSLTVIGWILVGSGIAGLLSTSLYWILPLRRPVPTQPYTPLSFSWVTTYFITVSDLVVGIAILKGRSWGRLLYIVLTPIPVVFSGIFSGFSALSIFPVVFYLVVVFFLTRPAASAFFRVAPAAKIPAPERSPAPKTTGGVIRKIAAVPLLVIATMYLLALPIVFAVLFDTSKGEWAAAVILTLVLVGLIGGCLAGGLALWGWRRWRGVLGVVFTVVGGMLVFLAISLPLLMLVPEMKQAFSAAGNANFRAFWPTLIWAAGVGGPVLLAPGMFLLVSQSRRDRQSTRVA